MKQIPEEIYNKITETLPIACVDICLYSRKGILLVKRLEEPAKNQWWVPGGRIHIGETIEQAAIRKVKEEVNLDISKLYIKKLGFDETIFKNEEGKIIRHSLNAIVMVNILPEMICDIKLDDTSSKFDWHTNIKKLDPYVTHCLRLCSFH